MTLAIRSLTILFLLLCFLLIDGREDSKHYPELKGTMSHTPSHQVSPGITGSVEKLTRAFGLKPEEPAVMVDVSQRELNLSKGHEIMKIFPISTSKYGTGNEEGSNKTPLGTHRIYMKVGEGAPIGTIFKSLLNTGRIATIYHDSTDVEEDLVLTRIMCLEGLEPGVNKGERIDSRDRGIYIHGTPEEGLIGKPPSHGCIRKKNDDVIELYVLVTVGTLVEIEE